MPPVPEEYYQPNGREIQPKPVGEEAGVIVFQYYPMSAVNYVSTACNIQFYLFILYVPVDMSAIDILDSRDCTCSYTLEFRRSGIEPQRDSFLQSGLWLWVLVHSCRISGEFTYMGVR